MPNPDTIYYCQQCHITQEQPKPCPRCGEPMTEYVHKPEVSAEQYAEDIAYILGSHRHPTDELAPIKELQEYDPVKSAASILGRKGGSSTSPAKQAAVRANGRKHTGKKG